MLRDCGLHTLEGLPLFEIGKAASAVPVCGLFLQEGPEYTVNFPPAPGNHMLSFCREGMSAAVKGSRDRLIDIGLRRRAQELAADQEEQIAFSHGQGSHIRLFHLHCGDDGMMVGHILIGNQGRHIRDEVGAAGKGRHLRCQMEDTGSRLRHIGSQIPAVRPGIGQQLLFIQALGVVQGLFCRVAKHPVGLPLQGSQVVELRGLFLFLIPCGRSADRRVPRARRLYCLGVLRGTDLFRNGFGPAHRQAYMMVFLLFETRDLPVPVRQHSQGRGLNTAHIQGAVVEDGEKPRGVDPHQPVRFLAAEGRLIQVVIVCAGPEVLETLPDRRVLHRGNPEAQDWLRAAGHFIHQTEDQFPFPSRVTGIDHRIHIRAAHQGAEVFKGVLLARRQHIAEGFRQDRQVVIAPLLITGVISGRVHRRYQVSHTPGHKKAVPLIKAIGPGFCTQGRRHAFCNARFLTDNQFHLVSSVSSSSSFRYSSSSSSSSSRSRSSRSDGTFVFCFGFSTRK